MDLQVRKQLTSVLAEKGKRANFTRMIVAYIIADRQSEKFKQLNG